MREPDHLKERDVRQERIRELRCYIILKMYLKAKVTRACCVLRAMKAVAVSVPCIKPTSLTQTWALAAA